MASYHRAMLTRACLLMSLMWFVAAPVAAQSNAPYLVPGQIESILLVPPPPAPGSDRQRIDLDAVLAAQRTRTEALAKRAQETRPNLAAFAPVLGSGVTAEKLPKTAAFLTRVTRETGAQVDRVKDCWER